MIRAGEAAEKKNLKIAAGLMCRHSSARQALIQKIRDGALGQVQLIRAYRMDPAIGMGPSATGRKRVLWQIRRARASSSGLPSGIFIELDDPPDRRVLLDQGRLAGGRARRRRAGRQQHRLQPEPRQLLDRVHLCRRHEGAGHRPLHPQVLQRLRHLRPRHEVRGPVLRQHPRADRRRSTRTSGSRPTTSPGSRSGDGQSLAGRVERALDAIRNDRPHNEARRAALSNLAAIMGRAAVHTGKVITWDEAMASKFQFCPNVADLTADSPAPVHADAQGRYRCPSPARGRKSERASIPFSRRERVRVGGWK